MCVWLGRLLRTVGTCLGRRKLPGRDKGGIMDQKLADIVSLGELKKADSDRSLPHQMLHYFDFA
jgi:hypothetical protein